LPAVITGEVGRDEALAEVGAVALLLLRLNQGRSTLYPTTRSPLTEQAA
jgi:hypothetical protein